MLTQPKDAAGVAVTGPAWGLSVDKVMVFAGGTANDPGDKDGTSATTTLFTVTGTVRLRILAKCTVSLAGAGATLEVGTALSTAGLIAQSTATDIDANEIWHDVSPDSSIEATTVLAEKIVSQNVIQTVATGDITSGAITYTCIWFPLSADSQVAAA